MTPLDALALTLPLAVVAAAALERWAAAAGARRLPKTWRRGSWAAALGWLVASRFADAAPGLDLALAGALAAGLLVHGAVQLVALRPLLGAPRGQLAFLALPLWIFATVLPWTAAVRPPDGDEPYYLLLTHSLVQDGDTDLADDYAAGEGRRFLDRPLAPQPGDPTGPRGELYSRHNLLLPLLLAGPYALFGKAGVLAAMAFLAALLAWRTLALARQIYPEHPGGCVLAFGTLVLGSPLLLYSGQVWVEVPAALALVVALEALAALAAASSAVDRRGPALRLLLALAALPLLKLRFTLVAIPLGVLALWQLRSSVERRVLRAVVAVALAAGLGVLIYNQLAYGNPLKIHSWTELDLARFGPGRYLQGLSGLFFDAAFGLFGAAPLWLLLVPALALALRRRDGWAGVAMLLATPYLGFAAPRDEWYGGWSPPFRYGMVFLPLLALLLVPLFSLRRRSAVARGVTVFLAGATLALAALFVAVPGWAYNLAHGRTHLTDRLAMTTGLDLARFVPSYVRPRAASWLWPPLAIAAMALAFRARRPRGGGLVGGSVALLAVVGGWPLAAAHWPTHTVELEDPWIEHRGGHLYPEMWTVSRVEYRGGWVLRPGEELAVPVVAGGPRLELGIELQFVRNNPDPLTLEVLRGGEVVHRQSFADGAGGAGQWRRLAVPALPWPAGTALGLRAAGPSRGGPQNGILFDRLEIRWP